MVGLGSIRQSQNPATDPPACRGLSKVPAVETLFPDMSPASSFMLCFLSIAAQKEVLCSTADTNKFRIMLIGRKEQSSHGYYQHYPTCVRTS